jgi:hypothetical protein
MVMEINNVQDIINNLPPELVYKISTYILKPQLKELMYDVRHFFITRKEGKEIYSERYKDDPDLIISWFANDICSYMNNYQPIMYGFVEKYYKIFFRLFKFKSKQDIITFSFKMNCLSVETEFNIKWGILNPKERDEMLKISKEQN